MKRILMTGASGEIGSSLRNHLANKYHFRGYDLIKSKNDGELVIGDINDFELLLTSMEGIDSIIHLAANKNINQSWQEVYINGIGGTYNVFEAARQVGIQKIVYASSINVHSRDARLKSKFLSYSSSDFPESRYGLGKLICEEIAKYFSITYGMSIFCIRIGSFYIEPPFPLDIHDDILKSWICPEDLALLVSNCIESENLGFQIFYGISNNKRSIWNIDNTRELVNYQPKCNAEELIIPPKNQANLIKSHLRLFRASVLEPSEALANWQSWLTDYDLEKTNLDILSNRLLPLIYFNLSDQGKNFSKLSKLKGIYRSSWLKNQLDFRRIIPFLKKFHDANIPILLLDDVTSILRLYDGQGTRRLYSLDILVHPDDISMILKILRDQDIWPKISFGQNYLTVQSPLEIWSPFDIPITITWRATAQIRSKEQAEMIWENARKTYLDDIEVFTLDLENHFLRSCIRFANSKSHISFFSLVDVAWMLSKHSENINWEKVIKLIQENQCVLPVQSCLEEINTNLELPVVQELLFDLKTIPISLLERLEYKWVTRYKPFPNFFQRIFKRIILYIRSPKIPGIIGFLRYFQYVWGGYRLLSLPRLAWRHLSGLFIPDWKRKK